jgi:formylmethanofuran dehydrogenase subunit E
MSGCRYTSPKAKPVDAPKCSECGEEFLYEELYVVDTDLICEECLEEEDDG